MLLCAAELIYPTPWGPLTDGQHFILFLSHLFINTVSCFPEQGQSVRGAMLCGTCPPHALPALCLARHPSVSEIWVPSLDTRLVPCFS